MFDKTKLSEWLGMLMDYQKVQTQEQEPVETEESLRAKGYVPEYTTEEYTIGEDGLRILKLYYGGSDYEYGIADKVVYDNTQYVKWEDYYVRIIQEPVLSIIENFLSTPKRWKLEAIYSGDEFDKEMSAILPKYREVLYKLTDKSTGVVFKCLNGGIPSYFESTLTHDEGMWFIGKVKEHYTERSAKAQTLKDKRTREKLMNLYVKGRE